MPTSLRSNAGKSRACRSSNSSASSPNRSTARLRSPWSHPLLSSTPPTSKNSVVISAIGHRPLPLFYIGGSRDSHKRVAAAGCLILDGCHRRDVGTGPPVPTRSHQLVLRRGLGRTDLRLS